MIHIWPVFSKISVSLQFFSKVLSSTIRVVCNIWSTLSFVLSFVFVCAEVCFVIWHTFLSHILGWPWTHYAGQADLECMVILWPQPAECRDYRYAAPHQACAEVWTQGLRHTMWVLSHWAYPELEITAEIFSELGNWAQDLGRARQALCHSTTSSISFVPFHNVSMIREKPDLKFPIKCICEFSETFYQA